MCVSVLLLAIGNHSGIADLDGTSKPSWGTSWKAFRPGCTQRMGWVWVCVCGRLCVRLCTCVIQLVPDISVHVMPNSAVSVAPRDSGRE